MVHAGSASVANTGSIVATAKAVAKAFGSGSASDPDVGAFAAASGVYQSVSAFSSLVAGSNHAEANVMNSGTISALAEVKAYASGRAELDDDSAYAYGVWQIVSAPGDATATVENSGDITATARVYGKASNGAKFEDDVYAKAFGVYQIVSPGGVAAASVINSGNIKAVASVTVIASSFSSLSSAHSAPFATAVGIQIEGPRRFALKPLIPLSPPVATERGQPGYDRGDCEGKCSRRARSSVCPRHLCFSHQYRWHDRQ